MILANSALSFSKKRTILTKIELGPEVQRKHLNKFMLKLNNSGYSKKFRTEILDSALKAFQKMIEDDKNDVKPMYRSRDWNSKER